MDSVTEVFSRFQNLFANLKKNQFPAEQHEDLFERQKASRFIQDLGQSLHVSQVCINTGIVYMHRFYVLHKFSDIDKYKLSIAALFLATKIEGQDKKLEHVIKVAHQCFDQNAAPLDVKSLAYSTKHREVVNLENILLQTIGFHLEIQHPHVFVEKVCRFVKASQELAKISYFLATTSLHVTTMCLQYKPSLVACVCFHVACKWSNWKIEPCSEGKEWYYYIDKTLTFKYLETLALEFIAILDTSPLRLKKSFIKQKNACPSKNILDKSSNSGKHSSLSSQSKIDFLRKGTFLGSSSISFNRCSDINEKSVAKFEEVEKSTAPVQPAPLKKEKDKMELSHSISMLTYPEEGNKEQLGHKSSVVPLDVSSLYQNGGSISQHTCNKIGGVHNNNIIISSEPHLHSKSNGSSATEDNLTNHTLQKELNHELHKKNFNPSYAKESMHSLNDAPRNSEHVSNDPLVVLERCDTEFEEKNMKGANSSNDKLTVTNYVDVIAHACEQEAVISEKRTVGSANEKKLMPESLEGAHSLSDVSSNSAHVSNDQLDVLERCDAEFKRKNMKVINSSNDKLTVIDHADVVIQRHECEQEAIIPVKGTVGSACEKKLTGESFEVVHSLNNVSRNSVDVSNDQLVVLERCDTEFEEKNMKGANSSNDKLTVTNYVDVIVHACEQEAVISEKRTVGSANEKKLMPESLEGAHSLSDVSSNSSHVSNDQLDVLERCDAEFKRKNMKVINSSNDKLTVIDHADVVIQRHESEQEAIISVKGTVGSACEEKLTPESFEVVRSLNNVSRNSADVSNDQLDVLERCGAEFKRNTMKVTNSSNKLTVTDHADVVIQKHECEQEAIIPVKGIVGSACEKKLTGESFEVVHSLNNVSRNSVDVSNDQLVGLERCDTKFEEKNMKGANSSNDKLTVTNYVDVIVHACEQEAVISEKRTVGSANEKKLMPESLEGAHSLSDVSSNSAHVSNDQLDVLKRCDAEFKRKNMKVINSSNDKLTVIDHADVVIQRHECEQEAIIPVKGTVGSACEKKLKGESFEVVHSLNNVSRNSVDVSNDQLVVLERCDTEFEEKNMKGANSSNDKLTVTNYVDVIVHACEQEAVISEKRTVGSANEKKLMPESLEGVHSLSDVSSNSAHVSNDQLDVLERCDAEFKRKNMKVINSSNDKLTVIDHADVVIQRHECEQEAIIPVKGTVGYDFEKKPTPECLKIVNPLSTVSPIKVVIKVDKSGSYYIPHKNEHDSRKRKHSSSNKNLNSENLYEPSSKYAKTNHSHKSQNCDASIAVTK